MENQSPEKVDEVCRESTRIMRIVAIMIGTFPTGVFYKSNRRNFLPVVVVFATFILTFFVSVIWLEIFNAPHNTIIEVTRAIVLFVESFSSITGIASVMLNSKDFEGVWDHMIEADTVTLSLGSDIDYMKMKRQSEITLICFLLVHVLFFTADYYLLTGTPDHAFVLSSFVFTAIHTSHNSCYTTISWFIVYTLHQRFRLLNTAMRNLNDLDIASILKELPLNKPLSRITVVTTRQRVERIKSAHDRYVAVCQVINRLRHFNIWLEVTANSGVVTAMLYAAISMVMDRRYNYHVLAHCLGWVMYRSYNFLLLVLVFTLTANELKHFSMQFLHKKVKFTAIDIFPIDFSLLYSVFMQITTLLVICVQFKLMEKSKDLGKANALSVKSEF